MAEHRPVQGTPDAGCWGIPCDSTLQAVVECAECPELFVRALTGAVSWHFRNRTTIDRVLRTPSMSLSWFAVLLALGAEVSVAGEGKVPLEALLGQRTKGRLEILLVPCLDAGGKPRPGLCWGEARVARTPADEPIVAAVASVTLAEGFVARARLAVTGAWARPVSLARSADRLVGGPLTVERISEAAAAVEAEVAPRGDFRGSAEYRRVMAGVLSRRALEQCLETQRAERTRPEAHHGR